MLDIVGTILGAALAVILVAVLAPSGGRFAAQRSRIAVVLGAWFVVAALLAAFGAFASPLLPVGLLVGFAVLAPVLVGIGPIARTQGLGIPLTTLVAVNAGRVVGALFLVLLAHGRLPRTFASSAGWGDIATALLALPVVWAIQHRVTGWRWITAAWNVLGMSDLIAAVTLGVGSTPGSLLRFNFESPGSSALAAFPWVLIPAFFVPLYLLIHVAIFAKLAASPHESPTLHREPHLMAG